MIKEGCLYCKHMDINYIGRCKAFPKGIPIEINNGEVIHNKILKNQKGTFIFELSDKKLSERISGGNQ